jgi:hypothetical protein
MSSYALIKLFQVCICDSVENTPISYTQIIYNTPVFGLGYRLDDQRIRVQFLAGAAFVLIIVFRVTMGST